MKQLESSITAVNKLHTQMNKTVPFLIKWFESNPPEFKKDMTLTKKSRKIVDDLRRELDGDVDFYLDNNYGLKRVQLKFRVHYQLVTHEGNSYHENYSIVWHHDKKIHYIERLTYTLYEVLRGIEKVKALEQELRKLEGKINEVKQGLSPLLY